MIARMKKVMLLCLKRDREGMLQTLSELGVVHVVPVAPPESQDLDAARQELSAAHRAAESLAVLNEKTAAESAWPDEAGEDPVVAVEKAQARKAELSAKRDELHSECRRLEPLGDFDPAAVRRLAEAGIPVRLYRLPSRHVPDVPAGAELFTLSRTESDRYVAVVGSSETLEKGQEILLPERSLTATRARLADTEKALAENEDRLRNYARGISKIRERITRLEDDVRFAEVRAGMGAEAPVTYLEGFCPADRTGSLEAAANQHGWGLVLAEPGSGDRVPTLIRNMAWVRPIKTVFNMIGVNPGYDEVDISGVFLLFFSVFFAMLIGDAGYGALFLLITWAARRKFRKAPAYPFTLLAILSVCTIVWGVLTGNYFGIANLPAPLSGLKIPWLASQNNLMRLCFLIGAVHLTVAHGWNVLRVINSTKALAEVGWIGLTWFMYFMACSMVLGVPSPSWAIYLLIGGIALVALFMTLPREMKTEWYNHIMLPLDVVGNFVDIVSYIRLFAVGMATFAIASSFNSMAAGTGFHGLAILGAAFMLFFGHAFNIMLCGLAVLVHGVRLNTLEFSRHIGMQWSGIKFRPFTKRSQTGDGVVRE